MCLELAAGGDLSQLITREKLKNESNNVPETACSIEMTRFYASEITLALEYLHTNNIIHMDLKPQSESDFFKIYYSMMCLYTYLIV